MCTALQHFQKVLSGGLHRFQGKEEKVGTEEEVGEEGGRNGGGKCSNCYTPSHLQEADKRKVKTRFFFSFYVSASYQQNMCLFLADCDRCPTTYSVLMKLVIR